MQIHELTKYQFDGKEFDSLGAVKTEVENKIGKIIDNHVHNLKNGEAGIKKMDIFNLLDKNRKELIGLLSIDYETTTDCSDWHGISYENRNILDYNE